MNNPAVPDPLRSLLVLRLMGAGLVLMGFVLHVGTSFADSPRAAEFDVYPLSHVSPAEAKRMLLELSGDRHGRIVQNADSGDGPSEVKGRVTNKPPVGERPGELRVVVDGESNAVLIRGPQELRALAEKLLEQIDRPPARAASPTAEVIRTYPIAADGREAAAAQLQKRFGDHIRAAVDPEGSRLIVVAAPDVQKQVAGNLSEAAAPPAPMPPRTHLQAESAVPRPIGGGIATSLAPNREPHLRNDVASMSELETQPANTSPPQIHRDDFGTGTDGLFRTPIPVMDRPRSKAASRTNPPWGTGHQPRHRNENNSVAPAGGRQANASYQFRNRSAGDVLQVLNRLFADRLHQAALNEYVLRTSEEQRLTIRFDRSANRCVFSGADSSVHDFTNLLKQVDGPPSPPGRITRLMQIRRTEPHTLEEVVNAWRGVPVQTGAAGASTKAASKFDLNIRNAAYQTLGINGPSTIRPAGQETPGADPSEAPEAAPLRRPSSDVEIQSLPDLDVIILRGLGADVEELTRIINEIERLSAETTPEIEVYQLQHVQGVALNQLIADVLESLAGTLQGRVTITALGKPNALLLIGWGEAVEAAKKLIAELDQPVAPATQVQIFRLEHAAAARVQTTIEQFYAQRTGLGPQVEITADPQSNSLVVSAAPRDLEEIALLIEQLDVGTSAAVNQARVIHLQNSLAADTAQVVEDAIQAARGGPGPGAASDRSAVLEMLLVDPEGRRVVRSGLLNDVSVTPDPRTNTLIISGPEASLDLLEVLIRELDETPATSAQIKVFQVINGDATEMVLMLRSLFPAQPGATTVPQLPVAEDEAALVPVRFAVDTRTNSIIATGSAGDLRIIEALLARLDAEEAQERINRVYRLRNSPAIDVASAINDFLRSERIVQRAAPGRPNPFQQIEQEVVVVPEPVGNALIISASPRFFEDIMEIVLELDEQPPQVLVQVIIAEVDLNHFHELGFELGLQDSLLFDRSLLGELITTTVTSSESTPSGIVTSTNEIIQAATLAPGFNFNNQPLGNSGSTKSLSTSEDAAGQALSHFNLGRVNSELGYGGLVLSASSENVSVLIRALDQSRHVEILSRPQIMTLDNQPAFIQVGERVPRIVASSINNIGQVNSIELEDVGLILGLTPRISPDGMVVMDIDAEKSQLGPEQEGIPISISAEGEIVRSPRVDITRAQTTISAASGQTVVLGGLITKDHMSMSRKVPWLGDIPLLGALFRYDSHMNNRRELLIIMTPHVIRRPRDADYHKQVEMARMSWCTADVYEFLGPGSPPPILSGQYDESGVPVIYPDKTPGMEWKLDHPPGAPGHPQPAPIHPSPSRPTPHPDFDDEALPVPEPAAREHDRPVPPSSGSSPQEAVAPVLQSAYSMSGEAASGRSSPPSKETDRALTSRFRQWWSNKNRGEAAAQ